MNGINGNISDMLYNMAVFSHKRDFSGIFCDFIFKLKNYIKENKKDKNKLGVLKYNILVLLEDFKKNKNDRIFGLKRISMENSLNELIFSTSLNEIKSVAGAEIDETDMKKLYDFVRKVICFRVPKTKNPYGFWCFLKLAFILCDIYGGMKNNIINENFEVINLENSVLKFTFNENAIELLYNYKTFFENPKSENAIYLIVKKAGKMPISFMFYASEEKRNIDELYSIARTLDNDKFLIFSGVFLLLKSNIPDSRFKNGVGAVNFEWDNLSEVTMLLSKITVYENALKYPKITSALNGAVSKFEIEARNVLVVTVKSKEQLEINIKNDFYHMPAFVCDLSKYEYIAIYQSENLFGKNSGIVYFGEISNIRKVRRNEILEIPKDSDELYYRIDIRWQVLRNRINAVGAVKSFAETSFKLLNVAENVSDLYIRSYDEFRTLEFLRHHFKKAVVMGDEEGIRGINTDKIKMEFYPDRVILCKDNKEVFTSERIFYRNNINSFFKKITEI